MVTKKKVEKFLIPEAGVPCAEAAMGVGPGYIPCGRPAKNIVLSRDGTAIAMCAMCADHNTKNRGATLAPVGFGGKVITAVDIRASLKPEAFPIAEVEDDESGPTDEQLATVTANVSRALKISQLLIPEATAQLGKLQDELKMLTEQTIPNAMTDAKIEGYTYKDRNDGKWKVEMESDVKASVTKSNLPAFIEYLIKRKEDDLVKRKITIKFGRDQVKLAMKFIADLARRKVDLHTEIAEEVNWQTLNSYVRERRQEAIEHQRDPDQELPAVVSIFKLRYVKFEKIEDKAGINF